MRTPERIDSRFDNTLAENADRFGGRKESRQLPSHHVRITSADLAWMARYELPLTFEHVAFAPISMPLDDRPNGYDFVGSMTNNTIERLSKGKVVGYGIRTIDGERTFVFVSCGGIAPEFKDDEA